MTTAEIAVEQLLAGLLGLAIVLLPFVHPEQARAVSDPAWAVVLLGGAYLVGAVFDKVFDHVLEGPERLIRLGRAGARCRKARSGADSGEKPADPFDQATWEAAARGDEGRADHLHYLRARLRCTRMVAVGAPLAGLAGGCVDAARADLDVGARLLPALLLLAATLFASAAPVPRTEEWTCENGSLRPKSGVRGLRYWTCVGTAPMTVLYAGTSVTVAVLGWHGPPALPALPVGGLALGLAATWAWARIQVTYMDFVARVGAATRVGGPSVP